MTETVVQKASMLKPSSRGELEITDLNNLYLEEKSLSVNLMVEVLHGLIRVILIHS